PNPQLLGSSVSHELNCPQEIRTDDEQPSKPPPSASQSSSKSMKGKMSPSGKLATISESESGDFEPDDEASLETGSSLDRLPLVDDEEAGGSGKGLNSKELQAIGFCGALKIPLFTYEKFGGTSLTHSIVLLFITGGFVNGPYALITTAVSADLGTACGSSARALATVTAIIDGAGSLGAAFGPLLTGLIVRTGWRNVFYMLIGADLAALSISLWVWLRAESVFNCRQLVSVTVYKMQCSGIRVVTVAALYPQVVTVFVKNAKSLRLAVILESARLICLLSQSSFVNNIRHSEIIDSQPVQHLPLHRLPGSPQVLFANVGEVKQFGAFSLAHSVIGLAQIGELRYAQLPRSALRLGASLGKQPDKQVAPIWREQGLHAGHQTFVWESECVLDQLVNVGIRHRDQRLPQRHQPYDCYIDFSLRQKCPTGDVEAAPGFAQVLSEDAGPAAAAGPRPVGELLLEGQHQRHTTVLPDATPLGDVLQPSHEQRGGDVEWQVANQPDFGQLLAVPRTSKSRSAARTQSCRFSRHGWNLLSSSTPTTRWAPSLNSSLVKPPGPQPISSTCRRARRSSIRSRSARLGSGGRRIADFTVETDIAEIKEYRLSFYCKLLCPFALACIAGDPSPAIPALIALLILLVGSSLLRFSGIVSAGLNWPRLRTARACSVMFADKPEICDCNSSRQAFTLASGCGGRDCQHIGAWRTAGAGRWRTSELRAAEPDGPERRDDRGERSPARLGGLDSGAPLIPAPAAGRLERRRRYSRCLATEPARRPAGRLSRREPWKRYPGELGLRQIPLVAIGRPPARREVARVPRGVALPSESASIAQRGLQLLLKLASARQSVQQLILGRSQIVSLTLAAGLACGQSRLKRLGVLPELSLGARQAVGATFGALQFSVQSAILGAPILRLGQLRFKPVGALLGRGRSDRQLGRFGVSASASFSQIFGCLGSADAFWASLSDPQLPGGTYRSATAASSSRRSWATSSPVSFARFCQLGFKRGAARLRLGQGGAQLAQLLGHCAGLGSVGSLPLSQLFGQRGFSRGTFGTQILVRFNELGVPDRCEACDRSLPNRDNQSHTHRSCTVLSSAIWRLASDSAVSIRQPLLDFAWRSIRAASNLARRLAKSARNPALSSASAAS
uniref:MFS domain-containing protein n=1 Tax=Macrostomum lignano TaxID=282301 RepID=A0A1I8GGW9_9PLAT